MRVKKLYILALRQGPQDQETIDTATLLKARYLARPEATRPNSVDLINVNEAAQVALRDSSTAPTLRNESGDTLQPGAEENIGVYIVVHGIWGRPVVGINPEQMALLVRTLGCQKIRKICLVACGLAGPDDFPSIGVEDPASSGAQKSYLEQFCEKFQGDNTMIAGWTDFVGVCRPDDTHVKRSAKKAENYGKKVLQPPARRNAHVLASSEDGRPLKAAQKKVYHWVREGGVTTLQLADWTDKEK